MPALAIYQDPDNPQRFRVSVDDGEAGIFELDFSRFEYGEPTDEDVPSTWTTVIDIPEE